MQLAAGSAHSIKHAVIKEPVDDMYDSTYKLLKLSAGDDKATGSHNRIGTQTTTYKPLHNLYMDWKGVPRDRYAAAPLHRARRRQQQPALGIHDEAAAGALNFEFSVPGSRETGHCVRGFHAHHEAHVRLLRPTTGGKRVENGTGLQQ